MMKRLWFLLLYFPATAFAQSALDNWYGDWTANYSGGDSGTCSITISPSTATQATLSGKCISDFDPQLQNLVSGQVTLDGAMTLTAGTTSTGSRFSGVLQGATGSGQWVEADISGTWTMSKLQSQTTAIDASGFWNLVVYTPSCNYTAQGTVNSVPYANGTYSITEYISNQRGGDCQNAGPYNCTSTGSAPLGQNSYLSTESQLKTSFNTHAAYCGGGSIQSVTIMLPDSISGAGIAPDGRSFSFQMTRAAATPTTYALTVATSGSGTVTGTGINCGSDCTESYADGTSVTLTATPSDGSYFFGWGGACIGTGSCVVTMNAAKSVTATFKPVPFVATTVSTITPTSATISTTIAFNAPDVGKTGAVYITAWVPVNGLGALGILAASMSQAMSVTTTRDNPYLGGKIDTRQETLGSVLAAADPNTFVLVQKTSPSTWGLVENGQLTPYVIGVLGDSMSSQNIIDNANPANLPGAQFCVGYGTSAAEMIEAGRMMPVAAIDSGSTATTASGSCNVAAGITAIEFYKSDIDHYFMTASTDEATVLDNKPEWNWARTGKTFNIWLSQSAAPSNASPVCRFFGVFANGTVGSHFYTVDATECAYVKSRLDWGWGYENDAFYAVKPTGGTCPSGTSPIYRAYNNGMGGAPNHRYMATQAEVDTMVAQGWVSEGTALCGVQ